MTPAEIMTAAAAGDAQARVRAWRWVGRAMCAAMGWREPAGAMLDAMRLGWRFARVEPSAEDARRFELVSPPSAEAPSPPSPPGAGGEAKAPAPGRPALLVPLDSEGRFWPPHRDHPAVANLWPEGPADILALDLTAGSAWFRRASCAVKAMPGRSSPGDLLQLWQGAHGFVGLAARAALAELDLAAGGQGPMHPKPWPEGWLVLDPAALPWKGAALKGFERIELCDADPKGPLGRALKKMNRRIGGRGKGAIPLVRQAA